MVLLYNQCWQSTDSGLPCGSVSYHLLYHIKIGSRQTVTNCLNPLLETWSHVYNLVFRVFTSEILVLILVKMTLNFGRIPVEILNKNTNTHTQNLSISLLKTVDRKRPLANIWKQKTKETFILNLFNKDNVISRHRNISDTTEEILASHRIYALYMITFVYTLYSCICVINIFFYFI